MSYWNEAFKELDELEDDVDLQSEEDVKKAVDFLNGDTDNTDHLEMVVDIDADTEEDLQDSYIGEILLMCPACHTLHYAHEEDIVRDEEEPDFVNVGEPCPHCKQENGFEIKGKVAEYVPEGEEPKEDETDVDDIIDIDDIEDEETEKEKAQFEESYKLRKQYVKEVAEDNLDNLSRLTGIELPTTKRVTESKAKSLKENLTEAPLYDLKPQYDARQSFYNKATVDTGDKGDKNKLYSYNTLVAEMKDGKPVVYGTYSQTTLRHIKEWLKQNGFKAENAKQILADYGVKREACKESINVYSLRDMVDGRKYEVIINQIYEHDDGYRDLVKITSKEVSSKEEANKFIKEEMDKLRAENKYLDEDMISVTLKELEESCKESKKLKEEVQEEAHKIADYVLDRAKGKEFISWDEFDQYIYEAAKFLYNVDLNNYDEGTYIIKINNKEFDVNDLVNDVRVIMSFDGWNTIFEGDDEGGLTTVDESVTKQDDIDAQADNKKELAKQEFEKKIDDADADRDDKLEEAKSNITESAHRITINDDKITIDDDTYDLLDSNDEHYLFVDKNGVQQEIRKDGKFDDEHFFGEKEIVDESKDEPKKKAPEITDEQKACKDEECKKKELDESLKIICDFDEYKPWSGAVDFYEEIEREGKLDDLEMLLEECYPEGITTVGINDILWFDQDWVREMLGMDDTDEEEDEDEEEVVEEDEFEESLFENLVTRYCNRVYENVEGYKATSCSREKDTFIVEGTLTYNNGSQEPTKFTFTESKSNNNLKKYVGINETFSDNKKAFTLNIAKEGNKLLSESLYYNYNAKVDNKNLPIKGKVATPKKK